MKIITRFAPSPTGHLHVGNLRTAIFNYILAKRSGGEFILRLDDTDQLRSTQKFSDQIKRDLEWLGFEWDRCEKQSERIPLFESAAKHLLETGYLYECFETPEELELKRRKQLNMGRPPVYDRAALRLSPSDKESLRSKRQGHWRFKLNQSRVEWEDGVLGPLSIDAGSVSDPILIRGDGQYLYTLASVVDDADFNINYVVRGSDHVTNTATQIQLFKALGYTPPRFAHHSLLVGPSGEPLSKRMNNLSLLELKNIGFEPQAVVIFMACLGGLKHAGVVSTLEEVSEGFVLSSFGSAPTKFDPDVLRSFSQKSLSRLSLNELEKQLDEMEVPRLLQLDFWNMAKENITKRSDLGTLWRLCVDGAEPVIAPEDKDFLILCKKLLPDPPRDQKSWSVWTTSIKTETGRSGKDLFLPLRKALTGKENGPDMNKLFPLLQQIRF